MDIKNLADAKARIAELEASATEAQAREADLAAQLQAAQTITAEQAAKLTSAEQAVTEQAGKIASLEKLTAEQAEQVKKLTAEAKSAEDRAAQIVAGLGIQPVAGGLSEDATSAPPKSGAAQQVDSRERIYRLMKVKK